MLGVNFQWSLNKLSTLTIGEKIPIKKRPEGLFEIVEEFSVRGTD